MLRSIPIKEPLKAPVIQPLIQPFHPDPSLVLWLLPQRDDKWYDYSGKGNHGAIHNAVWKPTPAGVGLYFNGASAYTNHGNDASLNITDAITIKAWVKTTATALSRIVSKDDTVNRDYLFQYSSAASRKVRFGIFKSNSFFSSGESTTFINDGKWHQIVGVNDETNLIIYVDGFNENSSADGGTIDNDPVNLEIGRSQDGDEYFNGTIGSVRIYNRGLSAAEIGRTFRTERVRYGV